MSNDLFESDPLKGVNQPPFCFQRFTLALLKIDTRLEKEKFSICLKLTFLFSNKISIFNIGAVNPPPQNRANHVRTGCSRGSGSYF